MKSKWTTLGGAAVLCAAFSPEIFAQAAVDCPMPGKPAPVALQNPSFDAVSAGRPQHWVAKEHRVSGHYEFTVDAVQPRSAPGSARIRQIKVEDFGVLDQTLAIQPCWRGQRARLSAHLRTEGADGVGAGLVMQTVSPDGGIQTWNHMNDARVRGTQPWKAYTIELAIPENAERLRVGVMLEEQGTLWADDISLEIVQSAR
ncbi:hypothetical protein [Paracidovorax sp. MALMAid1276]|uniref:hypothetical protein n=1 Tax=Paracidovorax sp. MALMAid1276 TaxID=3411631 RepID=UPI003B9C426D